MKYLSVLLVLLFAVSVTAESDLPNPVPNKRVYDFSNILGDQAQLNQGLLDYEKQTTVEIAIVTLESLPQDRTIFDYGVDLVKKWGIGKKGEDNGILVLIVKNGSPGNRLRMEIGYGLEGYINDAKSGRILDQALPYYTSGNFSQAASTIFEGIKENLKDYEPGKKPKDDWVSGLSEIISNAGVFIFFILIFVVVGFFGRPKCPQCKSKKLTSDGDFYVCKKCGKKFKKPRDRRGSGFFIAGGSGGFGGGGGGFGGGGSGGGGASRFYK